MKNRTYNGKNVIWESSWKQIAVITISLFFAIAALLLYDYSTLKFWGTIILFGFGGLFMLFRFVNPKNIFVKPGSELGKKINEEWFLEDLASLGSFEYSETGFVETEQNIKMDWNDIDSIFAYKIDLLTTDEICIDIFSNQNALHLNESTWGWSQFIDRLEKNLNIDSDWIKEVTFPAFEKNLTLIFDKKKRSQVEAIQEFYK